MSEPDFSFVDYEQYDDEESRRDEPKVPRIIVVGGNTCSQEVAISEPIEELKKYLKVNGALLFTRRPISDFLVAIEAQEEKIKELEKENTLLKSLMDGDHSIEDHEALTALTELVEKVKEVLKEADDYLTPHPKNYIGCRSILHSKFIEALQSIKDFEKSFGEVGE